MELGLNMFRSWEEIDYRANQVQIPNNGIMQNIRARLGVESMLSEKVDADLYQNFSTFSCVTDFFRDIPQAIMEIPSAAKFYASEIVEETKALVGISNEADFELFDTPVKKSGFFDGLVGSITGAREKASGVFASARESIGNFFEETPNTVSRLVNSGVGRAVLIGSLAAVVVPAVVMTGATEVAADNIEIDREGPDSEGNHLINVMASYLNAELEIDKSGNKADDLKAHYAMQENMRNAYNQLRAEDKTLPVFMYEALDAERRKNITISVTDENAKITLVDGSVAARIVEIVLENNKVVVEETPAVEEVKEEVVAEEAPTTKDVAQQEAEKIVESDTIKIRGNDYIFALKKAYDLNSVDLVLLYLAADDLLEVKASKGANQYQRFVSYLGSIDGNDLTRAGDMIIPGGIVEFIEYLKDKGTVPNSLGITRERIERYQKTLKSKKKSGKKVSDTDSGKSKKKGYEFGDRRRAKEARLAKAKAETKEKAKRAVVAGSEITKLYKELDSYRDSCAVYKSSWKISNQDGQYAWGVATDTQSDLAMILKKAGSKKLTKAGVYYAASESVGLNSEGSKPNHRKIVRRVLEQSKKGGLIDFCRLLFAYEEAEKNKSTNATRPVRANSNSVDAGWFDKDILKNHNK